MGTRAWLNRVRKDHHGNLAKRSGFRSRAAAKLQQLDQRFSLLKPVRPSPSTLTPCCRPAD